ncbi:hypothetical protein PO909_016180, partial [Leuciscus waleckii]
IDVYSEIVLLVKEDNKTTEVSTISSFSVTRESEMNPSSSVTDHQISSTGSFVIIVSAETLVLLLIAVPLIIVAVRKKKTTGNILVTLYITTRKLLRK